MSVRFRPHVPLSLLLLALLAACNPAPQGHGGGGFPPPEVTTLDLAPADVPVSLEYVGQTIGSREIEIRARVTGVIEKRLFDEGKPVKAGQPLFRLDAASFAAQAAVAEANLASAQARLRQTEREAARLKPLAEAKAASQKEYDDAAATLDLARAAEKLAQAQLQLAKVDLAYTDIRAPISGIIGRALKVEGALVQPQGDSLLATLAQTDPIHVAFGIPEAEALRLREELASGSLKLPGERFVVQLKTSDGKRLPQKGSLEFSDYKADTSTGNYLQRASFGNSGNALSPGQFVRVTLTGALRPAALVVPQRAVLDGPTGKFVYLLGKGKDGGPIAEPRPIVPGEWVTLADGNGWVVRQGLKAGEQVIVDGVARIFMPGTPVKPATSGATPAAPASAPAAPAPAPAAAAKP